jgi:hypothetical protein
MNVKTYMGNFLLVELFVLMISFYNICFMRNQRFLQRLYEEYYLLGCYAV